MSALPTKEEAIENARQILWAGIQRTCHLPPRERAIAAYYAGGPSIDELEQMAIAEAAELTPAKETTPLQRGRIRERN